MDSYLRFVPQPNGSLRLSPSATRELASALSDAVTSNKPVSIELTCAENLDILLRLRDTPTMSWALHSTSSPRHRCSQLLERLGSAQAGSGGDGSMTPFTSPSGKRIVPVPFLYDPPLRKGE